MMSQLSALSKRSRQSRSRSKQPKKKIVKKRKSTRSKSKSARSTRSRSKSANKMDCPPQGRTIMSSDYYHNSGMTPIHKILRNALGSENKDHYAGSGGFFGSQRSTAKKQKQVQICSHSRMRDISHLTSSSDDSDSSEDSLDNERYIRS